MDEWTFQQELHQLKSRVANMAARHSTHLPATPSYSQDTIADTFPAQLHDLRCHVARLEDAFKPVDSSRHSKQDTSLYDIRKLTEKFDMLSCDLQSRLNAIERGLSDLEDKTDRFDPDRFTPPASESSLDETQPCTLQHEGVSENAHAEEDYSSVGKIATFPTKASRDNTTRDSDAATRDDILTRLWKVKVDAKQTTLDMLRKYSARMDESTAPFSKEDAEILTSIIKFHGNKFSAEFNFSAPSGSGNDTALAALFTNANFAPLAISPEPTLQHKRPSLPVTELEALQNPEVPTVAVSCPVEQPAGVIFRDQEISRLDDLLRDAQEVSKKSEEHVKEEKRASEDLQIRLEASSNRVSKLEEACQAKNAEIANLEADRSQRDLHLRQMHDYLQSRDEQRERHLHNFQQLVERGREKSSIINTQERHIEKLQRLLQDHRNSKDDEIDRIVQGREDEIRRLQGFCEQKDEVVRSQEEIISRGARLIEQRDEELQELTRKLKSLEDDTIHERRQRVLTSKLLEARDRELVEAKASLLKLEAAQSNKTRQETPSPFGTPNPEHSGQQPGSAMWSPRPIPGNKRLASEAHRASAWDHEGDRRLRPVFGRPSLMGPFHGPDPSPRRRVSSPHPRKMRHLTDDNGAGGAAPDDSIPQPERKHFRDVNTTTPSSPAGDGGSGTGSNAGHADRAFTRQRSSARHSLPLDRTVLPPLPVPVAMSKVQSLADLRQTGRGDERDRRISRHQSMREMRERKTTRDLQSYVESDAEDVVEGGLGGAV